MELTPDFCAAEEHIDQLLTTRFLARADRAAPYRLFSFDPRPERLDVAITSLITNTYLLENGIAQGDRLSMSNSVELRLPLVDYRFLETVIGLRKVHPDHHLKPKHWFRQAMQDLVPDFAAHRPKRGFTPPVQRWLDAIFAAHGHQLRDGVLVQMGLLRPEAVPALARGQRYPGEIMPLSFKTLVLELWARSLGSSVPGGPAVPAPRP